MIPRSQIPRSTSHLSYSVELRLRETQMEVLRWLLCFVPRLCLDQDSLVQSLGRIPGSLFPGSLFSSHDRTAGFLRIMVSGGRAGVWRRAGVREIRTGLRIQSPDFETNADRLLWISARRGQLTTAAPKCENLWAWEDNYMASLCQIHAVKLKAPESGSLVPDWHRSLTWL